MTTPLTADQVRLIEQCVPRVRALARALAPRMPHASVDELESAGYDGLVQAALRYEPRSGVPFAAFAHYRVRGAMIDAVRQTAPQIRRRSRAIRALQATQALLEQAQLRAPSPDQPDPRTLRERVEAAARVVAQTTTAVILSKFAPADPDTLSLDPDGRNNAEDVVIRAEGVEKLRGLVTQCSDVERAMIDALYVEGVTMHEYAARIGTSVSTVSRHHGKLVARLGRAMMGEPEPNDRA